MFTHESGEVGKESLDSERHQFVIISGSHLFAGLVRIPMTVVMCDKPLHICKVMHLPSCEMGAFVGHPQPAVHGPQ